MRTLGIDPVHDTRETFRALLTAMSNPGTVETVPANRADRAVLTTLVDGESPAHIADQRLERALERRGRLTRADPDEATIIHYIGHSGGQVENVPRGTLKEPSDGATVVYQLETVGGSEGTSISLSGPGVPDTRSVSIGLPPDELSHIRAAQSEFPRGIDVVFTASDKLTAVPRSVTMGVV